MRAKCGCWVSYDGMINVVTWPCRKHFQEGEWGVNILSLIFISVCIVGGFVVAVFVGP